MTLNYIRKAIYFIAGLVIIALMFFNLEVTTTIQKAVIFLVYMSGIQLVVSFLTNGTMYLSSMEIKPEGSGGLRVMFFILGLIVIPISLYDVLIGVDMFD